jgi:hypothetical protein
MIKVLVVMVNRESAAENFPYQVMEWLLEEETKESNHPVGTTTSGENG